MGYLRKTSFLIFHDPDAPAEEKTLGREEIAAIETAHEAGKADRIEALIRGQLGISLPELHNEEQLRAALRELAARQQINASDLVTDDMLLAAIADQRKKALALWLEQRKEGESAEEVKAEFEDRFKGGTDPSAIAALLPTDQKERSERLRVLAAREGISEPGTVPSEVLLVAIVDQRKKELALWLEDVGKDGVSAEEVKADFEAAFEGGTDPSAIAAQFPTEVAAVEAAKAAAAARVAGPDGAPWQAIVQAVQDESIVDESAFKEYLRTTFRSTGEQYLRDFGWEVYGIVTSKAKLPDLTYRPFRTSDATVRFRDGRTDRLGINSRIGESRWDSDKQTMVTTGQSAATLWVKVADGAWAKDGNWGGHLQVTCATANGQWIDAPRANSRQGLGISPSEDGWARPQSAKGEPITFYDMGPYYEIWQNDRTSGRPLVVQDGYLRFVQGATPGKFNLQDATWS